MTLEGPGGPSEGIFSFVLIKLNFCFIIGCGKKIQCAVSDFLQFSVPGIDIVENKLIKHTQGNHNGMLVSVLFILSLYT